MKVIIAGGRDFTDFMKLAGMLATWTKETEIHEAFEPITEVVSGGARGADKLGEVWARQHGIPIKRMPADWAKHKKSAGPIRNTEMAKYADGLIAFWDGKSPGTKDMIEKATKLGLKAVVVMYVNPNAVQPGT